MLRLQGSTLARLLSPSAASPIPFPLLRLTSAVAPAVSPNPSFAVEEYLIDTCGLTQAQALKASTKISRIKSPTKPNAVLAFLAGLGLSTADVAAVVAKDPLFLCAGVERTLAPIVVGLTDLGLSRSEIAHLASLAPASFRRRSIFTNLPYYMSLFDSYENLLRVVKRNPSLFTSSPEKVVKPTMAFLQECGLDACDIAKLCIAQPWMLNTNLERAHAMVACAESLGVPRGSGMFRQALHAVAFLSEDKITAKVEYLKNTFTWSDTEVRLAISKAPVALLRRSNESLQRTSEFLINEVGLEPAYIARQPTMLSYCLEGRLRPRAIYNDRNSRYMF
uniref:Uncharacterized protein n=1 Tax=Avena sativa TaxID=4498 RepID=A0ACD5ZSH8_AVESA